MDTRKNNKTGAVLIAGGGIAGMQASLDLAESGFKVYLVEKESAIGGIMAQLDKTFPTNDCSMCIVSPKLVNVGRHPNITILTNTEIDSIQGEQGNFDVRIRKKARYIDNEKCTGCGDCEEKCPVQVYSDFNMGLDTKKAIYRRYPQAVPNTFAIEKIGISPCREGCPAHVNVQGYVALTAEGRFDEALALIRLRLPFPAVCGRVCHHPCETECNRAEIDNPVSIRAIKRFASDFGKKNKEEPVTLSIIEKKEKVAIIGAGPAGLTAANDLIDLGYAVTIFDDAPEPGGMMTSCLPDYRLPLDAAKYDIKRVLDKGIPIEKKRIGKDISIDDLKNEGYKAFFLAIGVQLPKKLKLTGIEHKKVKYGLEYLKKAKTGENGGVGKKVIVIGGGNVAIDCAKTAIRQGADQVNLVCLETRDLSSKDRMPAHEWEIIEAEEEGIIISSSYGPQEVISNNGSITGLKTLRCLSVFNKEGQFKPEFGKDTTEIIETDSIILAIGQQADFNGFEMIDKTPFGTFKVNDLTLETSIPGIFTGGDIAHGPASIIEAVSDGHEAAISIDRYLQNVDITSGRERPKVPTAKKPERVESNYNRVPFTISPAEARIRDFREVESGYTKEEVIKEAKRCLACAVCCECKSCVEACQAEAIFHDEPREVFENIKAGAIILNPGYKVFDARRRKELGYGRYKNVITSLEFERVLSASGPFAGNLQRLSDGKHPKKIAFIQCVGSRDSEHDYCSSVCCMYATKEAIIAMEHQPGLECQIFFIDMRAFGKNFDEYYERAISMGIKYIRSKPSSIKENPESKDLLIQYKAEDNTIINENFDMVVLSVGIEPPDDFKFLAEKIGIECNDDGFCQTKNYIPEETNREGIYACGAITSPKDIPSSVVQGSAAASKAMSLLWEVRNTLVKPIEYPEERIVDTEEPRIGVFVCHCGKNIAGVVDVEEVVKFAVELPNVVYSENNLYTCSNETQDKIKETIIKQNLNRVIVASCSPKTHEPIFRDTIRQAGLNPYLFEMANIRNQCSWVHKEFPEAATKKAKDLVRIATAKSRLLVPLKKRTLPMNQNALIIGGGISGISAAIELGSQGFHTYLIERENVVGGTMNQLQYLIDGENPFEILNELLKKVENNKNIEIFCKSEVTSIDGFVGNFHTVVTDSENNETKIDHGIVIIATGAREHKPQKYLYNENKNVITQLELESLLGNNSFKTESVVMIQCVESRCDERPYCSRICCSEAIKNALKLKELSPSTDVYVLYRDIRTYRFYEKYYSKAREKGVIFLRYEKEMEPQVAVDEGRLKVTQLDPLLNDEISIDCDYVVLSVPVVPNEDNHQVAQLLKVQLDSNKFFMEDHVKLKPVDLSVEGTFLCGLAHGPKTVDECVGQALAAASRAVTLLSKESIELEGAISEVVDANCDGCAYCIEPCPYDALTLLEYKFKGQIKKTVERNETACKGCGVCQATCPKSGIFVRNFSTAQIEAMVEAVLETN